VLRLDPLGPEQAAELAGQLAGAGRAEPSCWPAPRRAGQGGNGLTNAGRVLGDGEAEPGIRAGSLVPHGSQYTDIDVVVDLDGWAGQACVQLLCSASVAVDAGRLALAALARRTGACGDPAHDLGAGGEPELAQDLHMALCGA
jgi:hypothetical protein